MKLDQSWQRYFDGKHPSQVERYDLMVHLVEPPSVLDIGCGQGLLGYLICTTRKDFVEIIGLDNSEAILADGRRRFKGDKVILQRGNAQALSFEDEQFSTVVLCEVLEHLKDPVAAASEALRVLRPRGRVITSVPANQLRRSQAHCNLFPSIDCLLDLYEDKVDWQGAKQLHRWYFAWGDKK